MNVSVVRKILERRTGLNYSQNKEIIDSAIDATLEEIGNRFRLAKAHKSVSRTIAASAYLVTAPEEYSQILSVEYEYASGGNDYRVHLDRKEVSEYHLLNEGKQGQSTDSQVFYTISGDEIWTGPGVVFTGGTIEIQFQRRLTVNDIDDLPNGKIVVDGAETNLWPAGDPREEKARARFEMGLRPAEIAAAPAAESYSKRSLPDQVLSDNLYKEGL
ncbi:MAG: phage adaptor protein [Planctomycetota bacterium]|jgi:hypothetical protein